MNKRSAIMCFLLSFALLQGCRKDRPDKNDPITFQSGESGGVYITNEGNFLFGNATVSYFDIDSQTAIEDIYEPTNEISLGDVCQSMRIFNGKAYLVVNNSGKIEIVDAVTFSSTGTISGFVSPRYFLPVSNSKAYVSDLYSNNISIVNLSSNTITGMIPCAGATEEMALSYGKAFITNQSRDKLYVINTATDILEDSIQISYGSNSIREDKNGKLWVLCGGNSDDVHAGLFRIDPVTNTVEQSFQFADASDTPWRLRINGTNDTLYFLNDGLYCMDIASANLPTGTFVNENGRNFYGLGIDPNNNVIYISDAIDYVQRGVVYRYRSEGTEINSFLAGIIPGDFCFN